MIKRSLKIASWVSLRHPVIVIVVCVIVTGISLVFALRLTIPFGLIHLLPRDYPPLQEYLEISKDFASTPYLIGLIDCKTPRCISTYKELIMELENRLEGQDFIIDVQMGLTEGRGFDFEAEVRKNALLYLTPQEIEELKTKLSPSGISVGLSRRQKVGGLFGFLFHPIRSIKLKKDPLDLRRFIRPPLESGIVRNPSFRLSRDGTLFTSLNGRLGFFVAQPTHGNEDIEFDRRLKSQLDRITSESMQEFYEKRAPRPRLPKTYLERIYPKFTGIHLTTLDDYSVLHSDLRIMMVGALAGILLLFWLAYRRVRYLVYVGVSVVFSVIWTFALARIFFGSLNVITCIMAIPVMGLGVDYAIHLVHRYFLSLGSGLKSDDALATAIESGGRPIILAGATTAGVFYIMCLATFMGFSQNGFLMGTGIVLNMILVFTLLPALLTLDAKIGLGSQRIPRATVRPLKWMVRKCLVRPKITVAIVSVALVLLAIAASGVRINPRLTAAFYAKGNPSRETFNDFEGKINTSMHPVRLLVEDRDFEGALETTGLLTNVLDRYQDEDKVSFYESLSSLIPPYSQQRRAIEAAKRWPELDPDTFEKNFLAEMNRRRLSPTKLQRSYLPKIRETLSSREIITPASLGQGLSRLLPRYMKTKDGQVMLVTYAYPAGRRFAEDIEKKFFTDFSKEELYRQGKVRIIGRTQLNLGVKMLVKHDAILVTIIGSVVLIAMIYAFFRRIRPTLMVLIPLAVDFTVALGIFRITGAELTYASAIWVPMILGIADDYSIYIVDRFERGGRDAAGAVENEGKPIAITALTTIVAFGAMIFARMGGFVSSGILVSLGVGFAFIISVTLLPALLTITSKREID